MSKEHRVVITGMGIVSSIGNDVPTFWKNLQDGKMQEQESLSEDGAPRHGRPQIV